MKSRLTKILVIVGPTASGKSDLAVELAKRYSGEVISADSRQVYKGLDVGTGKITVKEMDGIPHHLLDIADPHIRFTALDWKRQAEVAVQDISSRGKLPIVCGGTGFYISSLIDDLGFPEVPADDEEAKALELKSAEELYEELKKLDPERAKTIDLKNKRRLSRAILIARSLGSVPVLTKSEQKYDLCMIGISLSGTELKERIKTRLTYRFAHGMIEEVERLHAPAPTGIGLSYERMEELGLEYRYISQFLQGKITRMDMVELLYIKIRQYAKRQMTWFKKDKRIQWVDMGKATRADGLKKIEGIVDGFVK